MVPFLIPPAIKGKLFLAVLMLMCQTPKKKNTAHTISYQVVFNILI